MVYFLSGEERRYIFRGLLSRARSVGVSSDWRGWSWDRPPLASPYDDVFLSLSEVASRYCSTGRDIYLRRVEGVKYFPNKRMVRGLVLHRVVEGVITFGKQVLYTNGVVSGSFISSELGSRASEEVDRIFKDFGELFKRAGYTEEDVDVLRRRAINLWLYETNQISATVDSTLSRHPYISLDSLVNLAIPVIVEQRLDGRFLGFSGNLSADALSYAPVVLDLKTGEFRPFQRLTTTGYALVLEALYEAPIDVGVLVNLNFDARDFPIIHRRAHIISEALRMELIEERDKKMEIVAEEIDPGIAPDCPHDCPFYNTCHGE
ncbi:MAG: type I-A CRISPR-associated protein Cas4/Csa1 [Candidatus Njordarchaeales archaeon]